MVHQMLENLHRNFPWIIMDLPMTDEVSCRFSCRKPAAQELKTKTPKTPKTPKTWRHDLGDFVSSFGFKVRQWAGRDELGVWNTQNG